MLTAVLTFALASALLVVLPGPDTLIAVRSLYRGGRRLALRTMAGSLTGLAIWSAVTVLGLVAVLRASHDLYLALRIVGAAYLITLGLQAILKRARHGDAVLTVETRQRFFEGGYTAGLLTNLLNPKVGVFFVTFLPGFVPAHNSVPQTTMLFGAIYEVETAIYFGVLLFVAGAVTRWMATERVRTKLDRITGVVFVAFGLRLALES